jgi:hypothetical protein
MLLAVASDAPPASVKEIPTTPNTGKACFVRLRFERCLVRCIVGFSPIPSVLSVRLPGGLYIDASQAQRNVNSAFPISQREISSVYYVESYDAAFSVFVLSRLPSFRPKGFVLQVLRRKASLLD